ncbi:serine/threonine-protein kinase ATM-like [Primulina eburnea]|uniref:serine/threonine-protein kinase ATM-like n=1 Tax=Primulina eburnea TaxID=1245227 RepID=UPI003C6C2C71
MTELVDVMSKELDQMSTSSTNSFFTPVRIATCLIFGVKNVDYDKLTVQGGGACCPCVLPGYKAMFTFQVCANTYKSPVSEKRARREHVVVLIKERVMGRKWPWSLLRLSLLMLFAAPNEKSSQKLAFPLNEDNENKLHELSGPLYEVGKGWQVIWNCLMRSLPTFCNLTSIDTKDSYLFPLEIWDLQLFKRTLSTVLMLGNILQVCFMLHLMLLLQENLAAFMVVGKYLNDAHSTVDIVKSMMTMRSIQGDLQDSLYLRQNMLPAVLAILNLKVVQDVDII